MSSRRQLRIVYTSSSSDDDEQPQPHPPPQPNDDVFQDAILHRHHHQQLDYDYAEEEEIEAPYEDPIPNMSTVTLNSTTTIASNSTTAMTTSTTAAAIEVADQDFIDVAESPSPPANTSAAAVDISDEDFVDVSDNLSLPSPPPPPPLPRVTETANAAAVDIPDEDFIDVSDNLSPPSPLPPVRVTETATITTLFTASDCPVSDWLRKMGLSVKREWLNSCQLGLQNSVPNFGNLDVESKAKLCFGQVLCSDMNKIGAGGVLPDNVCGLHHVDLAGPFVLQVDEVVNISSPLRERYKSAGTGLKRCLKLCMTDGVQRVFGMEYRPIKSLEALAPSGFKVVVRNVNVRLGLLMLVPEVLEVLGGSVEELEEARKRLVHEVNKPPRGKRTRHGVVPPLATRATSAAWPLNGVSHNNVPGNASDFGPRNTMGSASLISAQVPRNMQGANNVTATGQPFPAGRETLELSNMDIDQPSISRDLGHYSVRRESVQLSIRSERVQPSVRSESGQYSSNRDSGQQSSMESAKPAVVRETTQCTSVVQEAHELPLSRETTDPMLSRESTVLSVLHPSSTAAIVNEDACMVDYEGHTSILSRERGIPFTYLARLSVKWDAVQAREPFLRGRIKCLLTGVKGFQYRHQTTYNLWVFVDDGSHISEVLVHHDFVQSKLGYPPEVVTAALAVDSQGDNDMRNRIKEFQVFLLNFEGTMVVELNKSSDIPVALEMEEGCSTSDAWLLLKRINPTVYGHSHPDVFSNMIHLSP